MTDARAAGKRKGSPLPISNSRHCKAAAAPSSAGEEVSPCTRLSNASSPLSRLLYLTKAAGVGIYMLAVMAYVGTYIIAHMYWTAIKKQVKGK